MIANNIITTLARLTATVLIAAFFTYLYWVKKRPHLAAWTVGWWLLALSTLCVALEPPVGSPVWLLVTDEWLLAAGGLALLCAARLYVNARAPIAVLVAAAVGYAAWAGAFELRKVSLSPAIGIALIFLTISWVFWRESRERDTYGGKFIALVFLMWAPIPVIGAHFAPLGTTARQNFAVLASVPQLLVAGLMVMALYDEEKRRVEQNIVALASLNLTTSSFVGSEIERTLSHALDRLLSVVRLPAGIILLHHADVHRPAAAVSVGIDSSFCRDVEAEHLDGPLMRMVARFGGLVVFRDIGSNSAWAQLEHEEGFPRFRQLAMASGLCTVVGITLQAKEQLGVLLLGATDNRRFASSELRLLLALGQQIGMAVENSYLIQESSRKSEELHILNEIGRALNSTLDSDSLFEKIFTEMRRMFDVSNFYIALYDSTQEQVRFELEIVDGIRQPKRHRPAGNNLTEHILRTGEPLLLGKNMPEEAEKLGVRYVHDTGSFCGVPLLVNERAIGVLAIHCLQKQLYDKDRLEMMRVLASQATIAIENARLYRAEQTKARHLMLLNNISRSVITTLNTEKMLNNITQLIHDGLGVDHTGIGLLDYETKEVVIKAEAGSRLGALHRRLALGESLVGSVARSGQVCVASAIPNGSGDKPVLEGSASAIALPILYAEQLYGVLYVESAERHDFAEEEVLLLNTLADLISGALHNALTFQKAQEQAITDGLTGMKTHRFLMEALSAEWKRSTRANRAFSLVLIDLDRFKFVNDFYGHLEGDIVLHRVGHLLEETCRRSDVVARYGGDEFVILMPETNIEQGRPLAEKLRATLAGDPLLHDKNITASFGIASFPVHGATPQELIQIADASMYLSKHQGGNAVSTAEHVDPDESKKWKRDVLEAYLGVTLKRLFSTGPEAFAEICGRLEQFAQSLAATDLGDAPEERPGGGSRLAKAAPGMLRRSVVETLTALALAIDAKDHYTQGHSTKVANYAAVMAARLGLSETQVEEIQLGGMLHDIGKLGIPEAILNKTGPLDPAEWDTMKQHVSFGEQLLRPLQAISRIREMVLHHHEMYDGSGYPAGLDGDNIPMGARIISVADAYDTITSERTYKKARTSADAAAELRRCAGAQFDPVIVRVFLEALETRSYAVGESSASVESSAMATDRSPVDCRQG